MAERRVQGPQERAVRKDLRRLASLDGVQAYAAMALDLAKALDVAGLDAGQRKQLASELRKTMIELGKVATKIPATDALDEMRKRRAERRGA